MTPEATKNVNLNNMTLYLTTKLYRSLDKSLGGFDKYLSAAYPLIAPDLILPTFQSLLEAEWSLDWPRKLRTLTHTRTNQQRPF